VSFSVFKKIIKQPMDLVRNSAGEPRRKRRGLRLFGLLLAAGVVLGAKAGALPYGAQVSAGQATVTTAGTAMTVRQSTDRAAINWESFSVGQGSSVQFVQPSATSVALNRVVGGDPSVIQGAVTANGRIFLLNPNGILFTAGSQVNVGGIVASTLALSDDDFMAGRFAFAGASSSVIVNQGNITALADGKGGVIAMIAAKVTNDGTLRAEQGSVLLAAGSKVRLDLGGIVGLVVEQGAVDALVANGGAIVAPGGDVLLTAQAAAELASATVNSTGLIEAQTLATGERGRIRLLADMRSGSLAVSGQLDVSAPRGGDGGFVETSAADVGIADSATITALSAHGRTGTWLLDPDVLQVITGGTGTLGSLPATGQSQISPTALSTALTSANVDLQANTYIDFVNAFTYGGARDAVLRLYAPTIKLGADISTSTNKLGLQFGGLFAGNAVTYAGNVFLYDATNPASVTRTLTTKGGAVTFNGNIGANSAAATAYGLTVDASTGGALTHNAPVDGIFTAYNTDERERHAQLQAGFGQRADPRRLHHADRAFERHLDPLHRDHADRVHPSARADDQPERPELDLGHGGQVRDDADGRHDGHADSGRQRQHHHGDRSAGHQDRVLHRQRQRRRLQRHRGHL